MPNGEIFLDAVRHFWLARAGQIQDQATRGRSDQGARSAVTGGKHLDGILLTLIAALKGHGVPADDIHVRKAVTHLPGFYRPTKQWDLLVISNGDLKAAVELKAQVGPSFGNNFNNRVEEALGNADDLWTAFREGALGNASQPFLGFVFLLEECEKSMTPVSVQEPHYSVLPEFREASYAQRYEIFLRKLVRERRYSSACLLLSPRPEAPAKASYREPSADLSAEQFLRSLLRLAKD